MYTHLLDMGMLEDDARTALEKAFGKEYEVTIAGKPLTKTVLGSVLDGV
jgi:hypothetical protein